MINLYLFSQHQFPNNIIFYQSSFHQNKIMNRLLDSSNTQSKNLRSVVQNVSKVNLLQYTSNKS
jgi:hypothetical protein